MRGVVGVGAEEEEEEGIVWETRGVQEVTSRAPLMIVWFWELFLVGARNFILEKPKYL